MLVMPSEASWFPHRSPGGVVLRGLVSCPSLDAGRAVAGTARILRAMRRRTVLFLVAMLVGACGGQPSGAASGAARIAVGAPTDLDPAATGDAQSSAFIAQLFETLTAIDDSLQVRPALAESWQVSDGGKRVV